MAKNKLSIIILAAGLGKRMKSDTPKPLHKVAGLEILSHILLQVRDIGADDIVIVVSEANIGQIKKAVGDDTIKYVVQKELNGTGGAVQAAMEYLDGDTEKILITYGDVPLVKTQTYRDLLNKVDGDVPMALIGFHVADINEKYGRFIVEDDELKSIVEYKDATDLQRAITLCNSGLVAVRPEVLSDLIFRIDNKNSSGEYYLTDIVGMATENGLTCKYTIAPESEMLGINTREILSLAEKVKQDELRSKFMEGGVTMIDPETVYFSYDTKIGRDVTIQPNVFFGVGVEVADSVEIRAFCHLEKCKIEPGAVVGPFARLRPDTVIGENAHIGNFVEIKKSKIGNGSKVSHLSYIGDAEIGTQTNIGAGTITCNYDGFRKYPTRIGDNVLGGSHMTLVAPVSIGDGAVVGAGSVITKDVAADDLAVARADQRAFSGKALAYRKKRNQCTRPQ